MFRLNWNPLKWSPVESIFIIFVLGILCFIFILIDLLPAKSFTVSAQVISEKESWTLKQQYRCNFVVENGTLGRIEKFYYGRCHDAFVPGQKVKVKVGVGIISGQVMAYAMTRTDDEP